ncbi:MAG: rod shape-determining protein MreC [bacterium]
MSWIANLPLKNRRMVHLSLVLVLSLSLVWWEGSLTAVASEIVQEIFYNPFFKARDNVEKLADGAEENRLLRQELAAMSVQLSNCEETAREGVRLREVLGFEPPAGYRLLPARVISVAGEGLARSALINRGVADSVYVNQTVINRDGLIGRIWKLMPNHAEVQLLTHPQNRVAARVVSSREMGIVRYMTIEGLVLSDFPNQGEIQIGDTVISSGLGGIYPPGLKIGTVRDVERPENRPDCDIRLELAANLGSMEELFILISDKR